MSKKCFVIMPFSATKDERTEEYWTYFFENFLKPNVEPLGFKCERSKASPSNIIQDIIEQIHTSDLVVAVLTDFNPNVLYELGVRHALKRGTIMIMREGEKIPSDFSHFGVIKYLDSIIGGEKFKNELISFIAKLENSSQPDNPVAQYLEISDSRVVDKYKLMVYDILEKINWQNLTLQELASFKYPICDFKITCEIGGKVWDVGGAKKTNGAKVILWDYKAYDHQLWELSYRHNYYMFKAKHSNKYLSLPNDSIVNGTEICQSDFEDSLTQKWFLENDRGAYYIVSAATKSVIDADIANVHIDGCKVQQWTRNTNKNQRWRILPVFRSFE